MLNYIHWHLWRKIFRIVAHMRRASFLKKKDFPFYLDLEKSLHKTVNIFWKFIKSTGQITQQIFCNFTYVSSYLRTKLPHGSKIAQYFQNCKCYDIDRDLNIARTIFKGHLILMYFYLLNCYYFCLIFTKVVNLDFFIKSV